MLKVYEYRGATYQFDDSDVPDGAVEVKAVKPAEKKAAAAPKNKATKPSSNKGA